MRRVSSPRLAKCLVGCILATIVGCETVRSPFNGAFTVTFDESSVTLNVGEEKEITYGTDGVEEPHWGAPSCAGIAEVTKPSTIRRLKVRGLADGRCTAGVSVYDQFKNEQIGATCEIIVGTGVRDAGAPDASVPDAGPIDDAGTPICSATVAKVAMRGDRELFIAYTDVDSGDPNQTCPIHTSTNEMGDIVFSFLAGSPGYTIDGRGNYEILSATPADLTNAAGVSYANTLEDQVVTITFRRRIFADEDASVPPPIWTMKFRMVSDPDPAKWKVQLFSFSKE
jgi:hypothetical protein